MTSDILEKLFSSGTLVKTMRLFLFNPDTGFDVDDIAERTKSRKDDVRHETKLLEDVGFIKRKVIYKDGATKTKKGKSKKKKVSGFILNQSFIYLSQLRAMLVNEELLDKRAMKSKLQKAGNVRLVIASGVFLQDQDSRLDLFIVADKVRPAILHKIVKDFEAVIGSELRYALLGSEDFRYRLSVRDRLLRDVFDGKYTEVVNTYKKLDSQLNGLF